MPNAVQGKYVLGKHSVVGDSRRKWEDRVFIEEIQREGGGPLLVGIVADGVGSADFGSRGAQLTIDTVVHSLELSQGNDLPRLLETAITAANSAVYQENQKQEGDGLTTVVVAIIANDRVYIGNVGDSRAYWIQANDKMLVLTRDHSYFNIYGGNPNNEEAGVLVNAIGKKEDVQVDLGFYLRGDNQEEAYKLGMAGLPLKPGDAIVLCSDGLIKNTPQGGSRYVKDTEIVNAIKTEQKPDRAAIKMVSTAEGRRPDDNVSAVTIQRLSGKKILWQIPRIKLALPVIPQNQLILVRIGLAGCLGLLAFVCMVLGISSWFNRSIAAVPTQLDVIILHPTREPNVLPVLLPSSTPGLVIAYVENVIGTGGSVRISDRIVFGQQISAFKGGGVKLSITTSNSNSSFGLLYLFDDSSAIINFNEKLKPELDRGAIYIQSSAPEGGEVHFGVTDKIFATISGSRMILELVGNDIWLYCFEGNCEYHRGAQIIQVATGSKMVYHWSSDQVDLGSSVIMHYEEKWDWNRKCGFCMWQIIPSPTPHDLLPTQGGQNTKDTPKICRNTKKTPVPCQ